MSVVERQPQAVQTFGGEELGILLREEVLKELVEEVLILLLTEDLQHGRTMLGLLTGIARDELREGLLELESYNQ